MENEKKLATALSDPATQIEGGVSMESDLETVELLERVTPRQGSSQNCFNKISNVFQKIKKLAKTRPHASKKKIIATIAVLIVIVGIFLFYSIPDRHIPVKKFTNIYSFVPDEISKSALIPISLPEGVNEDIARASITFSPEILGEWEIEEIEKVVVFKPYKALRSGVYYAVNMDTGSAQMSGDFYVDEDPKVETIFPKAESETHEDTEITIVFNRPMVPLTTLNEQEELELPITITPETKGRFKWISTRSLQFIPEATFLPSSQYVVEIKKGLYSLDGLPVEPLRHTFITRPIRYEYMSDNQLSYRSPIVVAFNQAVDLDATKSNIEVTKNNGEKISVVLEYGDSTYYDYTKGDFVTEPDPSKLFVYQREDVHGRSKFWDFNTRYDIRITGATPLFGTEKLSEEKSGSINVPDIVESVNAQSSRTDLARPDLFDPQGTLIVTFYDEVDTDASKIVAKGLTRIEYGEKCRVDSNGDDIYIGSSCVMEVDKRKLIMTFDASVFSKGESFDLELKKIVTTDRYEINADVVRIPVKTYPVLEITAPPQGSQGEDAQLDGLTVCTNVPLQDPGDAGLDTYIKTSGYIVYGSWHGSWHINGEWSTSNYCKIGEFQTELNYGLLPQTNYALSLSLTDVFGQTAFHEVTFKTEVPNEQYTRFHNMQQQYNVTTPDKTRLTYAVENLEYVDMHICRVSPETFLELTINNPEYDEPPRSDICTSVITKQIPLPPRYWVNNYFQVQLKDYFEDTRGHYVLTFSHPLYSDSYSKKQMYDRTFVSVTNLAIGRKEVEYTNDTWSESQNPDAQKVRDGVLQKDTNIYWINESKTLTAVSGAVVTQYMGEYDKPIQKGASAMTNTEGIARVAVERDVTGAVVYAKGESAVFTDWADMLQYAGAARDASRTYVYTDRPIYRPTQTVYIRGIDRIGFDGSYEVWEKNQVPLMVFNARDEKVYETKLAQDMYGTFETEFTLPEDSSLGIYRIEAFGQSSYFSVEEYVPAAFKVETVTKKDEYVNGETIKIDLQADYYFGVPLQGGSVTYSVTAQDYYFDKYTDEYFSFGNDWYYCYYCGYGDQFLFRGEVKLNDRGHATIEQAFDFETYFENEETEGSKIVTVTLTVKDENGRSVSTQKSVVVHKGEFYLGSKLSKYYAAAKTPIDLKIKTVDVHGVGVSITDIEKKLYRVDWDVTKRQEVDGGFYYRSEKKLVELGTEKIHTDRGGNWDGTVSLEKEGEYEFHVTGRDTLGNVISNVSSVYIYGAQAISVPPNNNYELELEVEKAMVAVGDTASVLIKSPYPYAKVLITAERGTVYDYWIAEVRGGMYVHTFPIKEGYTPNVYVSALLLSPEPEVKFGSTRFEVGRETKELVVDVIANKTHYLPGEEVILTIKTKDNRGNGIPAEVSVAVADLSVLALKGNPKKDPLIFFYDGFPLSVTTGSNIKNMLHEMDIPTGTKGGGGANPEDLAKKKRGVFKDTAFWSASVVTDMNGNATVRFTLPDNLTTWQVESLGVTQDTKLGVDYTEFTSKKDLMAVPLKPRFVVPGDTFALGAKVFNQTDAAATVDILLESETLHFEDKKSDTVFINKGESKTVYFNVSAPKDKRGGKHTFTFTAKNDLYTDQVEQEISITPNTTYETVATANSTKDDQVTEFLYVPGEVVNSEGGLTINANATLAVFMTDALRHMVTYPYGCSEQLSSALSTIGIMKQALTIPNIEGDLNTIEYDGVSYTVDEVVAEGLDQIYEAQTIAGGFAYYKGLDAHTALTIHVLGALIDLKKAGFLVRQDVIDRAIEYVELHAIDHYLYTEQERREFIIYAEYVLRKLDAEKNTPLTPSIRDFIDDKKFLNEEVSSVSLAYLAILTATGYSDRDRDRVYDVLQNRIDRDGRGAYMPTTGSFNYALYETMIKNTALTLAAFVAHKDEHVDIDEVLRWLLASRDHRGVWGSTQDTFIVVSALVDYLEWQEETKSHFSLTVLIDSVLVFVHEFNPSNIFKTFTEVIPMDALPKEKFAAVTFVREHRNDERNRWYYDMSLKYFVPTESLPPRDEGITITRELYALTDTGYAEPLHKVQVGDVVKGKITLVVPGPYTDLAVEDFIPAGFEIVNMNLATEDQSLDDSDETEDVYYDDYGVQVNNERSLANTVNSLRAFVGGSLSTEDFRAQGLARRSQSHKDVLRPSHVESHDDRVFAYIERLTPGVYEYTYYLRALVPGTFQQLPARAEVLYFPEVFGRTFGNIITVVE